MTTDLPTLLVIDDDRMVLRVVQRALANQGFEVLTAATGEEGLQQLERHDVDVALIDLHLPGIDGLEVLRTIDERWPDVESIIFTGQADISTAFTALNTGASDYYEKPIQDWKRFQQVLKRAHQVRGLKRSLRSNQHDSPLIGSSSAMVRLRDLIGSVAQSTATVLVTGESGVGKEVVAEAVHKASGRSGRFVRINCHGLPKDLIEGELFGWKKGAHSTAVNDKQGLFEAAGGGTVLLDEIGDMPFELQGKLLRVLESRHFRPIGGTEEREFTARVVCATNADLPAAIAAGKFRQDLLFRINVISLEIPPLRDRVDDIPVLTYHFIKSFNETEGREVRRVPPDVMGELMARKWEGNVRELRNVLHRAVLMSPGDTLMSPGLPRQVTDEQPATGVAGLPDLYDLPFSDAKKKMVEAFTRAYLERRLADADGVITRAAEASGMQRPNFKRLMKQFGVEA